MYPLLTALNFIEKKKKKIQGVSPCRVAGIRLDPFSTTTYSARGLTIYLGRNCSCLILQKAPALTDSESRTHGTALIRVRRRTDCRSLLRSLSNTYIAIIVRGQNLRQRLLWLLQIATLQGSISQVFGYNVQGSHINVQP